MTLKILCIEKLVENYYFWGMDVRILSKSDGILNKIFSAKKTGLRIVRIRPCNY